ncbi:MAG: hypothetical protein QOE37_497 [Microbacteriaceae bacterium]|nr:hypothetical protein [Microbacteriaceae bacterium]
MTTLLHPARGPGLRPRGAWARLLVGVALVAVVVGIVLAGVSGARSAGSQVVHAALDRVTGVLTAQHDEGRTWPSDLVLSGSAVIDADSGVAVTTVPAGLALSYERSVDGTRFVLTMSDRGSVATFDSARGGH